MLFGKRGKNSENKISTIIEGTTIEIVKLTTFLGLFLDSNLNWKDHILQLSQKLAKSIGILTCAKQFLNVKTLRQLYYSFLFPYISYCNIIWGNASENTLWPIFRQQKHAIRIIYNMRRRDSSKFAFKTLKLLRLPDIYKFSVLLFLYKYKNGLLPPIEIDHYPTRAANQQK